MKKPKRPRAGVPVIPQAIGASLGDLATAAEMVAPPPAKKAKQKRPKPQLPKRAAPLPTKLY